MARILCFPLRLLASKKLSTSRLRNIPTFSQNEYQEKYDLRSFKGLFSVKKIGEAHNFSF